MAENSPSVHGAAAHEPEEAMSDTEEVEVEEELGAEASSTSDDDDTMAKQSAHDVISHRLRVATMMTPKLHLKLLYQWLVVYVVVTCLVLATFTIAAYKGMKMDKVIEPVGKVKDSRADDLVQLYNTISGYLLAFAEVMMGVFMRDFLAAYLVYLHNALWFLHRNYAINSVAAALRKTLIVLFPVLLLLLIGNSVRSLQAAQKTVGVKRVMTPDDLHRERPLIELVKEELTNASHTIKKSADTAVKELGVLTNAVRASSVPFELHMMSRCSPKLDAEDTTIQLNTHDLDSTSVTYGFTAHEWNSEMLRGRIKYDVEHEVSYGDIHNASSSARNKSSGPIDFDMTLALDMFAQAKVLLDRALMAKVQDFVACDLSDSGSDYCNHMHDSLHDIGNLRSHPERLTPESFVDLVSRTLPAVNPSLPTVSVLEGVRVEFKRGNLSDQIRVDVVEIDGYTNVGMPSAMMDENDEYEEAEDGVQLLKGGIYGYKKFGRDMCGATSCVFVADEWSSISVPQQIVAVPSQRNCSDMLQYSKDLRIYYPLQCDTEENSLVVVGFMKRIAGDEYGSDLAEYTGNTSDSGPYIINPVRQVRIVMTRYAWHTEDLATRFRADCDRSGGSKSCQGLVFRLPITGRYVFASEDALPSQQIASSSVVAPHSLVKLNHASLYTGKWGGVVLPERLDHDAFDTTKWRGLSGEQCSVLVSSYIRHVDRNFFYLERSTHTVVRAGLLYLFSNGSVTDLREVSILTAGESTKKLQKLVATNSLEHIRLKGDVQLRSIRVSVPRNSYIASLVGCGLLLVIAALIVCLPTPRVRFLGQDATRADQYIAIMNNDEYPDVVHSKTLEFRDTNERLRMQDFAIDELTLAHRDARDQQIAL